MIEEVHNLTQEDITLVIIALTIAKDELRGDSSEHYKHVINLFSKVERMLTTDRSVGLAVTKDPLLR